MWVYPMLGLGFKTHNSIVVVKKRSFLLYYQTTGLQPLHSSVHKVLDNAGTYI